MKNKASQQGSSAELLFASEALEKGYSISLPFGNSRYDLILDNGKKMFRVQIKSSWAYDKSATIKKFKVKATTGRARHNTVITASRTSNGSRPYNKEDIDVMVIFIAEYKVFYIIPIAIVENITGINVYPSIEGGNYKYEKYKNNWSLFN